MQARLVFKMDLTSMCNKEYPNQPMMFYKSTNFVRQLAKKASMTQKMNGKAG